MLSLTHLHSHMHNANIWYILNSRCSIVRVHIFNGYKTIEWVGQMLKNMVYFCIQPLYLYTCFNFLDAHVHFSFSTLFFLHLPMSLVPLSSTISFTEFPTLVLTALDKDVLDLKNLQHIPVKVNKSRQRVDTIHFKFRICNILFFCFFIFPFMLECLNGCDAGIMIFRWTISVASSAKLHKIQYLEHTHKHTQLWNDVSKAL